MLAVSVCAPFCPVGMSTPGSGYAAAVPVAVPAEEHGRQLGLVGGALLSSGCTCLYGPVLPCT